MKFNNNNGEDISISMLFIKKNVSEHNQIYNELSKKSVKNVETYSMLNNYLFIFKNIFKYIIILNYTQ